MQLDKLQIAQPQLGSSLLQGMGMKDRVQRTQLGREAFEFNRMKQVLAMGNEHLPTLKKDEYPKYINWLKDIGAPHELLPEDVSEMSDKEFETLKQQISMGSKTIGQMHVEQYKSTLSEAREQVAQANRMALEREKQAGKIQLKKMGESGGKNLTEMQLTQRALQGDKNAQEILDAMQSRKEDVAKASSVGKIEALKSMMDVEGTARAVVEGRETIENVRNTFGVPVQEMVRAEVFDKDKEFNFVVPRSVVKNLTTSLNQQEKQRGGMGSFVRNLNKQLNRIDDIGKDINRWGVRAFDLPKRELVTRLKGSGKEKVLESYLLEISNEIAKLSTGSSASIRELSTDAQERWAKIHDPNLSMGELKIILDETREMANMRLESTNEEIEFTKERLKNLKSGGSASLQRTPKAQETISKFEILSVD